MKFHRRATSICAAVSFGLLWVPGAAFSQGDGGPVFKSDDIINSTVRVVAYDSAKRRLGWGTGWIISPTDDAKRAGNAIVVTTWNTIRGASNGGYVQIIPGGGGDELPARIRSTKDETKKDFDIAFIEVKGLSAPALKIAGSVPDSARPVYSSGYSFVADTNEATQWSAKASIQSGTVSKNFEGGMTRSSQAPVNQIEHNTPLDPGFSGGPLIDRCGNVVGVNTKDGGIRIGEDLPVAMSKGSRFALENDELISIANQEGVPFEKASADCNGTAAAVAAPIATAAPAPKEAPKGLGQSLRENTLVLAALITLALAALAFGIWRMLAGNKAAQQQGSRAVSETPTRPAGTSVPAAAPTAAPATSTKGTVLVGPTIELSGRSPEGKPLSFKFTAEDLGKSGKTIGSDPSQVDMAIDEREDYKVSRQHARITYDGKNFVMVDLKSTNKTKVGGASLEPNAPKILVQGDELEFADVKLKVSIR